MTKEMMDVQALLGKSADSDFLREMIGFAAQRLMELEVGGLIGAAYGEKSAERQAQRNGYRDRDWETRAGTVELRIPKLRTGSYFPGFLEPRRLAEKVIREAYPNEDAITRLVGAILLEQNDEWAVQRARYMTLESVAQIGDDPLVTLPPMAA